LIVIAAGLGGCAGFDGVEFNGKIFDAVGLTGSLGKRQEPKTEARAPLVLPPTGQTLHEPGALAAVPAGAPAADPAWPQDRDKQKQANASALQKQQQAYCREDGNWKEKALRDDLAADKGPAGSCTGSVFSIIGKTLFGE
jgi:hypothetical protein